MLWNDKDLAKVRQELKNRDIPRRFWVAILAEVQDIYSDDEVQEYLDCIERERIGY